MISWALQHVTPASSWNRTSIPGLLVIATNSLLAERAVAAFLGRREHAGLFGVLAREGLVYRHDKGADGRPLVTAAWRVHVRGGMERAVLDDLNHFVALALERDGGYASIDPHLSMAVARRTLAAHQARRVILTHACAETMRSGKVKFEPAMHATYLGMISNDHAGRRPVTVAMLDAAVEPADLADGVDVLVKLGHVPVEQAQQPPLAHGAVTASIIGCLAPTATILVYPVAGGRPPDLADESQVMWSIQSAVVAEVDVIVMCLALCTQVDTAQRWSLEMILTSVGDKPVMIAAAGNRDRGRESPSGRFPGIHLAMIMVSAVDKDRTRPAYSRFALPEPSRPALHVVAPGGAMTSAAVRRNTPLAWAAASSPVPRSRRRMPRASSLGRSRAQPRSRSPPRNSARPSRLQRRRSRTGTTDVQHCEGLIRQLD